MLSKIQQSMIMRSPNHIAILMIFLISTIEGEPGGDTSQACFEEVYFSEACAEVHS